jgi:hypothetical protein
MNEDKRIPELPELTIINGELYFAIYDPLTDTTYKIKASLIIPNVTAAQYAWDPLRDYNIDEIVVQDNQIWISQQNGNLGVVPGTDVAYWVADNQAQGSAITFWSAGVFTENDVYVANTIASHLFLFRLADLTRPFNSTDFNAEFSAGKWECVSDTSFLGIPKVAHGFAVNDLLTFDSSGGGTWSKNASSSAFTIAIVRVVVSANFVIVSAIGQRIKGFAGLTVGAQYYKQTSGSIGTTATNNPLFIAISATEGITVAERPEHFRGYYVSAAALTAAVPSAIPGDYAIVDTGAVADAQTYIWDNDLPGWVLSQGTPVPNASTTISGVVEEGTDAEVQDIANTGIGGTGARLFVSIPRLWVWWAYVKGVVNTWALKQTFTTAPRFSSTTASQILEVDASKDLISVAKGSAYNKDFADDTETQAGTEAAKPIAPARLSAWWTYVKSLAQTWALKQTFTTAPRFSSTTASQILEVDASKDLVSAAKASAYNKDFADDTETQTGTEAAKPIAPARLSAWWTWVKTQSATISGSWVFAKLRLRNVADTFTSIIQNTNTAARTYSTRDRDGILVDDTDLAAKLNRLVPTGVKSANYSAAANEFVPTDVSAGSFNLTFPNAPADGTLIATKIITAGTGNSLNLVLQGADVFNKAGGANTGVISFLNHGVIFLYEAATAIWYTISSNVPTNLFVGLQDLFVPASSMWPRTTGGSDVLRQREIATSLVNIHSLNFDQTTQEFAQFHIVMPRNWNNSTIRIRPYWTAASGSGGVVFGFKAGAYSDGDALTTALGTEQTSTDTLLSTNAQHVGPYCSALTVAGSPADGDFIVIQVSRNPADGSDTIAADVELLGFSIELTTDSGVAA